MLTPTELNALPEVIVELVSQAESDIIQDMARRISKMDYATDTAVWQMNKLREMGAEYEYIISQLSTFTGQSQQALYDMFVEAGTLTLKTDDAIYKQAGLNVENWTANPKLTQIVSAGLNKTNGLFENLSRTTANTATRQFEKALDLAHMQITSGAFSYQEAIKRAVKSLSAEGLEAIIYPSGHIDHLDVATRRATLTGVNQTAAQLQMARADQFGCDLVETTAHGGARPEHAEWQGKVFSRSGKSKKYPDFIKQTGYGTGPGLCGWNCRHSFYPFFEGLSEKNYSKKQLAQLNEKSIVYNDKSMTIYDAQQVQRSIERNIRKYKREYLALDAASLDTTSASVYLAKWRETQVNFHRQTGLRIANNRSQVGDFGRSQASAAVWQAKRAVNSNS